MISLSVISMLGIIDWNFGNIAIAVIVIAAIIAIVYIAFRAMGVAIPAWAIQVVWVLVIAFVCVIAVKILIGMF